MLGKDLLIATNGRVIAAQRTCNLNMQQDTIEVCSPVSGPWREYIPSTLGWDVSCDGLIYAPEYADELMEVLTSRQKVRLSYYDPEMRIVRSGYAIPTGLQQGASISDLASYSLTFQGTGELGKVPYSDIKRFEYYAICEDIMYQWKDEKSHPVVSEDQLIAITVYRLEVKQVSRVAFDTSGEHCYLYKYDGDKQFYSFVSPGQNLWLYQHEVAHIKTQEFDESEPLLLTPGTYYIARNGYDDEEGYIEPLYKMLSLPTE